MLFYAQKKLDTLFSLYQTYAFYMYNDKYGNTVSLFDW